MSAPADWDRRFMSQEAGFSMFKYVNIEELINTSECKLKRIGL